MFGKKQIKKQMKKITIILFFILIMALLQISVYAKEINPSQIEETRISNIAINRFIAVGSEAIGILNILVLIVLIIKNKKNAKFFIGFICALIAFILSFYAGDIQIMEGAIDYTQSFSDKMIRIVFVLIPLIIQVIIFILILLKLRKRGKE